MMARNSKPVIERNENSVSFLYQVKLEKVFGVTLNSRSALACDPNTGVIAYPAGCTVVLYHSDTRHQSHIINASRKSITTVAFSSCGRYIVTGETGHHPAVRVWDLLPEPQEVVNVGHYAKPQQVAEFFGHKFGVGCVAFSPSNKIIVSVGSQHDMIVNVWDWRNNIKVASNKVSTKVKAIAFAENGNYFVTVGNRLVKFWYLDGGRNKFNKEAVPLMGRSAILGDQRNNNFVDVACGKAECGDNTYAITRSGLLCEFNNRRLLDKWVELRTSSANSISVGEKYIFVGCDAGIVRCFDPQTLQFVTTLPRSHYLGVDVSLGLNITHMSSPPPNAKYPDIIALTFDEKNHSVACVYNDHSIYIWDVWNIHKVGKSDSLLFHSGCIWGVETAPTNCPLPPGSFLTCSSDDTIRVWTLDRFDDKSFKGMYVRNIYSKELLKVLYTDAELTYLKDRGSTMQDNKEFASYDTVNGVRSIRLSPDGKHLASGDRTGNIRIHETANMSEVLKIEAHDAEVLCLEFSGQDAAGHKLMASASRDRLIHVFDVNRGFEFLQTLDDHSSSITSVKFLNSQHGNLQMISCGADKSLIFRSLAGTPNGTPQFQRSHNATGKNTLYDMEIDAGEKHVLTACQDRNVRVYNVVSGKHTKTFKGCIGDEGCLIKVVLDKSGSYLATSSTDKSLCVYDYYTGECMATMRGHSELATGLCFTNDCKRVISTSGDGCIFVWKLPHDMVVSMHARYNQQVMLSGKKPDVELFSENESESDEGLLDVTFIKRMSLGKLPAWAQKKMTKNFKPAEEPAEKNVVQPKGRWAERAANQDIGKNTYYFSDVDSSLESDLSNTKLSKAIDIDPCEEAINAEETSQVDQTTAENDLESTAHDADVDSDHDYRQQPLYYPTANDSASGSEFTVNNIDVDELRKSVRRSKRASLPPLTLQPPPAANNPPTSLSTGTGSQDSDDDDDDEASTPSGENTDANPISMISTSVESLYQNREKYLQSTYESLSGNELESAGANKSSISAQHHTRRSLGLRNVAVVNAAKQTKNDVETTKKREFLNKMIADTRKKLQCIGYVSPLKASQSICDLSHVPEKEGRKDRHRSTVQRSSSNAKEVAAFVDARMAAQLDGDASGGGNMRRACSLSDLSHPSTPPHQNNSSISINRQEGKYPKNPQITRLRSRDTDRSSPLSSPMMRSSSVSVLNPSDSDEGGGSGGSGRNGLGLSDKLASQSRLMRPTISSQNKVASSKNSMRKRHSHSTLNLSSITREREDSSSEESEAPPPSQKPAVPPRKHLPIQNDIKHFNNMRDKLKSVQGNNELNMNNGNASNRAKWSKPDVNIVEVSTIQESKKLCNDVAMNLVSTASEVVKLYDNLTNSNKNEISSPNNSEDRTDMVKTLQLSIVTTQKLLHDLTLQILRQDRSKIDVNQTDSVKKLNDLIEKGFPTDESAIVNIMQQYSDILLGMMQQKIEDSNK